MWAVIELPAGLTVERALEQWWNETLSKPELPFTSVCLRRVYQDEQWGEIPQSQWRTFFRLYAAVLVYETNNTIEQKTTVDSPQFASLQRTNGMVKTLSKTLILMNDQTTVMSIEERTTIKIHGLIDLSLSHTSGEPVRAQLLHQKRLVSPPLVGNITTVPGWFYFSIDSFLDCQAEMADTWNMFDAENDLSKLYPEDRELSMRLISSVFGELLRIVDSPNAVTLAVNIVRENYCRLFDFSKERDRVRDVRIRNFFRMWAHSVRKGHPQRKILRKMFRLWLAGMVGYLGVREEQVVQLFKRNKITVFYQDSSALDLFSVYANRWVVERAEWLPYFVSMEKKPQIERIFATRKAHHPASVSDGVPIIDEQRHISDSSLSSSSSSFAASLRGSPIGSDEESQTPPLLTDDVPLRLERVARPDRSGRRFKQVFDPKAPIILFDILVTNDPQDVKIAFEDLVRFLAGQGFNIDRLRGEQPKYESADSAIMFFAVESLLFRDAKHLKTFLTRWHTESSCLRLFGAGEWLPNNRRHPYELSGGPRQTNNGQGGIVIHPSESMLLQQAMLRRERQLAGVSTAGEESLFDRVCKSEHMTNSQAPARRLMLIQRAKHSSLTGRIVHTDNNTGIQYDAMSYSGLSEWVCSAEDDLYERLQAQCPDKMLVYAWSEIKLADIYAQVETYFRQPMNAMFVAERQSRSKEQGGGAVGAKHKDNVFGKRYYAMERALFDGDLDILERFVREAADMGSDEVIATNDELRFRKNGSFSIKVSGPERGLWNDFLPFGTGGKGLAHLVSTYQHHSSYAESIAWIEKWLKENDLSDLSRETDDNDDQEWKRANTTISTKSDAESFQENQNKIGKFLYHCKPITSRVNPAAIYLREHRGLHGCEHLIVNSDDLVFNPTGYFTETDPRTKVKTTCELPCLVVKARSHDGVVTGAQRIYLDPNRNYAKVDLVHNKIRMPKKTYCRLSDSNRQQCYAYIQRGKLFLDQQFDWPLLILLAEGPETALSGADVSSVFWVYAALGIQNIEKFRFHLTNSKRSANGSKKTRPLLIILGDNDVVEDEEGQLVRSEATSEHIKTARAVLSNYYQVLVVYPTSDFKDFNDIHQYYRNRPGEGRQVVRKLINQALVPLFNVPNPLEVLEAAAAAGVAVRSMDTD